MSNLVSTKQKSESHMDSVWSDCTNNSAKVITPISHKKQTVIIISVYINSRRGKTEKEIDVALISDWPTTGTNLSQSLVV